MSRTIGDPMRPTPERPRATGRTRDLVIAADRAIHALSRHWLFIANLLMGLYVALPTLAPILDYAGLRVPARIIYLAYRMACHQRPDRSFFIFGNQMAFCERDTALYGTILVAGIVYGMVRPKIKPLSLWVALAMSIPLAVDGTGQLLGLWESFWWLRVITGSLFGLALVWLAYPYLDRAFAEIRESVEATFDRAGISLTQGKDTVRE